jgi:ComF family protein
MQMIGTMLADLLMDQPWWQEVDALCPIPMHWTRRLSRGFNPSYLLAQTISEKTGIPHITLLKRGKFTRPQVGLSASSRKENIKDSFVINPRRPIEDSVICLVDDVMTTGATLNEAAKILRQGNVNSVYAAVLAKADHAAFDR